MRCPDLVDSTQQQRMNDFRERERERECELEKINKRQNMREER